jgi:hypothetical protein
MTWTQASKYAEVLGGRLVFIDGDREQAFLLQTFGGEQPLWIGLLDPRPGPDGPSRVWSSTNGSDRSEAYQNWAAGQPARAAAYRGALYAAMNGDAPGRWWAVPGETEPPPLYAGIVEVERDELPQPPTLTLARAVVAMEEPVTVHFTAPETYAADAWVGLFHANVDPAAEPRRNEERYSQSRNIQNFSLTGRASGELTFSLSEYERPGLYDLRLFTLNGDGNVRMGYEAT